MSMIDDYFKDDEELIAYYKHRMEVVELLNDLNVDFITPTDDE